MSETQQTKPRRLIGDFAPKLVEVTDLLDKDIWSRGELSPRDRSLITIAALVAAGTTDHLPFHLEFGRRNGLTQTEIAEAITHLAFYAGWPRAMSAILLAKQVLTDPPPPDA
jgi:4-carboxymuconolactone decarboxylase